MSKVRQTFIDAVNEKKRNTIIIIFDIKNIMPDTLSLLSTALQPKDSE